MKFNINLSEKNLKEQFEENRELVISVGIFGVSILLFLIFILPNILAFPGKWSERSVETEKLDQIKKAKAVLENINKDTLDSEMEIVNRTLPSDKNFELILNAISQAAVKSNVIIKGYKFTRGPQTEQLPQGQSQALVFDVNVEGGVIEAGKFVTELKKVFPVSETRKIEYSNDASKVTVAFYFKSFTEVNAQDVALSREKTAEEEKALKEISGWEFLVIEQPPSGQLPTEEDPNESNLNEELIEEEASSSADPL